MMIKNNEKEECKECNCEKNEETEVKKEEILTGKIIYSTEDGGIPGSSYAVTIDFDNKKFSALVIHNCSALDCESSDETYEGVKLTDDELILITKITKIEKFKEEGEFNKIKVQLSKALIYLARGEDVYVSKSENAKDYEWFKEADINNDGIVTNKEIGDERLESVLKEFSQE